MPVAGLISATVGEIGSAEARSASNRELEKLLSENKANPLIGQRLGLAKTLFNARMPGATAAEKNIYTTGANTTAQIQRGATDASQFLTGATNVQAGQNKAFNQLSQQEMEDYQRRYGNLIGAEDAAINEDNRVYQNKVSLKGAQQQNNGATWQELSNFGIGMANLGVSAGWKWPQGGGGSSSTGLTQRMPTEQMPHTWGV
jgi:hypothetical protein